MDNGIEIFELIEVIHSSSKSISFIRNTPKFPAFTFFEGHPTFRLISLKPLFSIIFAAFGAYGIFVFSDICINSTETIGINSKGFLTTNGRANIVAKKIGVSDEVKGGGYRSLVNVGENGGQEVPHLHFHIFGGEKVGKMIS